MKKRVYVKPHTKHIGKKTIHIKGYWRKNAWAYMTAKERKAAQPRRKHRIHTKKWHDMVEALHKKGMPLKNARKLATWKLGPKAFLKGSRR